MERRSSANDRLLRPSNDDSRLVAKASGGKLNADQVRILRALQIGNQIDKADLKDAVGIGRQKKYNQKWNDSLWSLDERKLITIDDSKIRHYFTITRAGKIALEEAENAEHGLPTQGGNRPIVYFNNCNNRDHVGLYGSGAFFDLGISGRQGTQARNLSPGQTCIVAERAADDEIEFTWYSFANEALLVNEERLSARVYFGRIMSSETLPKARAARSKRYSALFKTNGDLKNGSVFHKNVPTECFPPEIDEQNAAVGNCSTFSRAGAGFGDPAENKLVESAAIRAVVRAYKEDGWSIRSVERERCGFDLECTKNGFVESVEVKGVRGTEPCFIVTAGEVEQARKNATFVLVAVTSALSASPKIVRYSGAEFCRRFNLSAIQYRASLNS